MEVEGRGRRGWWRTMFWRLARSVPSSPFWQKCNFRITNCQIAALSKRKCVRGRRRKSRLGFGWRGGWKKGKKDTLCQPKLTADIFSQLLLLFPLIRAKSVLEQFSIFFHNSNIWDLVSCERPMPPPPPPPSLPPSSHLPKYSIVAPGAVFSSLRFSISLPLSPASAHAAKGGQQRGGEWFCILSAAGGRRRAGGYTEGRGFTKQDLHYSLQNPILGIQLPFKKYVQLSS